MYAPDQFTYSGWVGGTTWYAGQQWPLPYATGAIEKGKSMTLKGSFGAGTELELLLVGNSKKGKVEIPRRMKRAHPAIPALGRSRACGSWCTER